MMNLDTLRLALVPFTENDAPFIFELLNSPGWLQFIGNRNIKSIDDAKKYIRDVPQKSYAQHGFGLMLVKLKENNISIGMCGLIKRDDLEDVDIGFAFLPAFIGKGYAYEAAFATLTYAKEVLNLKRIVAITMMENKSSVALLKKIGMHFEKMIRMKEEELMLFALRQ